MIEAKVVITKTLIDKIVRFKKPKELKAYTSKIIKEGLFTQSSNGDITYFPPNRIFEVQITMGAK